MRVFQVIHGYPMRYNAGSEVYTQGLAQALADSHEVHVFTRQENGFDPDYVVAEERDPGDDRVTLHVINMARVRDGYRRAEVDRAFGEILDRVRPEIVHVGHLNHLSTSLVLEARTRGIPVVFTLHDYWLMCPRGQFIQMNPIDPEEVWALCDSQEDGKCARRCYSRYHSGFANDLDADVGYWTSWVRRRMRHVREVCQAVSVFLAPSRYLLERHARDFGLPRERIQYLDYGFPLSGLASRCREAEGPFTFGYIGTHIPAKGIHHLIEAFGCLSGGARLRLWGRPRGMETEGLKALARQLPTSATGRIEWLAEYRNQDIVPDVFNRCDAIVVPSIWAENSPLVIHEAQQVRVPVITADYGGMAEYVHHEENGLLFTHRDPRSLAGQMQRFVDNPDFARRLGERGYLQSPNGDVLGMDEHARAVEEVYQRVLSAGG